MGLKCGVRTLVPAFFGGDSCECIVQSPAHQVFNDHHHHHMSPENTTPLLVEKDGMSDFYKEASPSGITPLDWARRIVVRWSKWIRLCQTALGSRPLIYLVLADIDAWVTPLKRRTERERDRGRDSLQFSAEQLQHICVVNDGLSSTLENRDVSVPVSMILGTRPLREKLFQFLKTHVEKDPFFQTVDLLWCISAQGCDCHSRFGVPKHEIGEAETRAMLLYRHLHTQYPILIQSSDTDLVALGVWHVAQSKNKQNGFWIELDNDTFHIPLLVQQLHDCQWAYQAFFLACILSGNDFVEKSDTSFGASPKTVFEACRDQLQTEAEVFHVLENLDAFRSLIQPLNVRKRSVDPSEPQRSIEEVQKIVQEAFFYWVYLQDHWHPPPALPSSSPRPRGCPTKRNRLDDPGLSPQDGKAKPSSKQNILGRPGSERPASDHLNDGEDAPRAVRDVADCPDPYKSKRQKRLHTDGGGGNDGDQRKRSASRNRKTTASRTQLKSKPRKPPSGKAHKKEESSLHNDPIRILYWEIRQEDSSLFQVPLISQLQFHVCKE